MSGFELAPAAVVRASAWPIEALAPFGASELDPRTDAEYRGAIDREREALWALTAHDPRFMKALAFASPSLVERALHVEGRRGTRNKRVKHAETSLYRYLARAASRTTPSGLWAGIALARFGAEDHVTPAAPRYAIAPDLAPFAAAMRALGERGHHRGRARWRVNPTLRPGEAAGTFELLVRLPNASVEHRLLQGTAGVDRLLDCPSAERAGSLADLARVAGVDGEAADALAHAGVLVGGLALPSWFESPWDALDAAGEQLVREERVTWDTARKRLSDLASELSAELDRLTPEDVTRRLAAARDAVTGMIASLGLEVAVAPVVLRCDFGLPFDIVFGPARRDRFHAALAAYQKEWLDGASPMTPLRAARRRALAQALSARGLPLGARFPEGLASPRDPRRLRPLPGDPGARDPASISPPEAAGDDVVAPWGGLVGRLGGDGVSMVFGVDDNPAPAFARHGALLGEKHAVAEWLAARIDALRAQHGVITADLVVPFDRNPNVLARTDLGALRIEPWGAEGPDLLDAELRAEGSALFERVPSTGRLSIVALTSAHVSQGDPVAEQMLFTGFLEYGGGGDRLASVTGRDDAPTHAASRELSTGAVIRRRSTRLTGLHLARLLAGSAAARFSHWRAVARELGWSRRVTVSVDGATPLLLDTASPLGLESALEGAREAHAITVVDEDDAGWLDGRHVADAVIPFSRTAHAFSGLRP